LIQFYRFYFGHRSESALRLLGMAALAADVSPRELLMTTGFICAPPAAIYYAFKRYMVGVLMAGAVKS